MSQMSTISVSPEPVIKPPHKRKTDQWRKCFGTLNNFQKYPHEISHLKRYLESDNAIKFTPISGIAMQPERAPTTGTPHLQMYIEFTPGKKLSSKQIHAIPGLNHIAVKPAPRSVKRCLEYVSKSYSRLPGYEALQGRGGIFRGEERAKSKKDILDLIRQGKMTPRQVAAADPDLYMRHHAGLDKLIGLHLKDRTDITKGVIYFGPTGCGKTIKAWAENPNAYPFSWPEGSKLWLDKYYGGNSEGVDHDTMIADEFRSNRLRLSRLLDLIGNSKPLPCQTKGGWTTFNSHRIIVTTNEEPMNWFPNLSPEKFSMMRRRLLQHCEIWDFSRPDLPHWAVDYQGPKVPLEQLLSEIICTKRTSEVPRTVGPDHQISRGQDYNFGNRYVANNISKQALRSWQNARLTGKKRKRKPDRQGPRRPSKPTGPFSAYGQTSGGTTLEIDEE